MSGSPERSFSEVLNIKNLSPRDILDLLPGWRVKELFTQSEAHMGWEFVTGKKDKRWQIAIIQDSTQIIVFAPFNGDIRLNSAKTVVIDRKQRKIRFENEDASARYTISQDGRKHYFTSEKLSMSFTIPQEVT